MARFVKLTKSAQKQKKTLFLQLHAGPETGVAALALAHLKHSPGSWLFAKATKTPASGVEAYTKPLGPQDVKARECQVLVSPTP